MISKIQRSTQFQGLGSIDVHHHCFPETVAELRSEFQDNKYGIAFTDFPVKPEEHLAYMDEVGVQTAVIVSCTSLPVEFENLPLHRHLLSRTSGTISSPLRSLSSCAKTRSKRSSNTWRTIH